MTLIALPTAVSSTATQTIPAQRNQLRELQGDYDRLRAAYLIEEMDADEVESPLAILLSLFRVMSNQLLGVAPAEFLGWLEQALPLRISDEAGKGATDPYSRLADSLDELDGVLLTALEEISRAQEAGMTGAQAEAHLVALWRTTFTSVAAVQENWLEAAFIKRGCAIIETVYPNADERRRLYHYGLSPLVGQRFEAIAPQIRELIAAPVDYGAADARARLEIFESIGNLLVADRGFGFRVRATETDQALLKMWPDVMAWWMQEHGAATPAAEQLRSWQRFVVDNIEYRLGVAIGAVVAQAWTDGSDNSFAVPSLAVWKETTQLPWFGFWARELLRWGTHDPFIAFCLSQRLAHTREEASARRPQLEAWLDAGYRDLEAEDLIDPQLFLAWQGSLPRRVGDAVADLQEPVNLTGTDGRRSRYSVIPVREQGLIRWLDPAGFELAQSIDAFGDFPQAITVHNDYELRTDRRSSVVHRTFSSQRT